MLHRNADILRGRIAIAMMLLRWHRLGAGSAQSVHLLGIGAIATAAGNELATLAGEQNAKLIAKVVFKVYQTGVGINVFGTCSYDYGRRRGW